LPLKAQLEEALNLPVFVENEVNLIALGESWRGAGKGIRNLICVSLGAGIGAGIVINGVLYRGSHNAAGEIGYFIPNEHYFGQAYDTYGCLETLAGSNGIVARVQKRLAAGEPSMLKMHVDGNEPTQVTAEMVLSAAQDGDQLAQRVVDETVDYLSVAVVNLICALDPDLIVISGDLVDFGSLFIEPIKARIEGFVPEIPEIISSDLKIDAAVLGAVAIVLRQTSDEVFVQAQRAGLA
jgi:predicted NBD/HSP70 family sugar kinase